ncbi:Structural maintenance of chromosomes protein 6 [Phlyctochytrium bullatum]|nr:Structural maintenance of chromosomes protein 6 [Phlyctochytrium bullatum]
MSGRSSARRSQRGREATADAMEMDDGDNGREEEEESQHEEDEEEENEDGLDENDENYIPTSQQYAASAMRKEKEASVQSSTVSGANPSSPRVQPAINGSHAPSSGSRKRARPADDDATQQQLEKIPIQFPVDQEMDNAEDDDDRASQATEPATAREATQTQHSQHGSQKRLKKGAEILAEFDPAEIRTLADDCGTVESIELVNFMCHSYLQVQLNSHINFIIGHNGSGKSAILTALTLCLGGKATFTNRASSVKDLLKEGESMGMITVKLRNQGPDSYKPEYYGRKIIIERRFNRDGQGGYRIKSEKSRVIADTKEELTAICDHLSIAIDNPMAILTQDTSRKFLANSTPKDKYSGTLLAQLSEDHQTLNDLIQRAKGTVDVKEQALPEMKKVVDNLKLKFKASEIEKQENIDKEIENERNKLAWAIVQQKEEELQKADNELQSTLQKLEGTQPHINAIEHKIAQLKTDKINAEDRHFTVRERGAPLVGRKKELVMERRAITDQKNRALEEEKRLGRERERARNEWEDLDERIKEEERKLRSNLRGFREEKQREMEALKAQYHDEDRKRTEILGQIDETRRAGEEITRGKREIHSQYQSQSNELTRRRRYLDELKSGGNGNDRYAAFNRSTASILRAIDDVDARRGWKGQKPAGPVGIYCKLKRQEYSSVIETVLGNNLNAYVLTDSRDTKTLQEIFKRNQAERTPILMFKGELFDYSDGEPDPRYTTILRCLEISNPYVLCALIVASSPEKTVLVETRAEGDRIAEEGNFRRRNINGVFTKDLIKLGGANGGLQTNAMISEYKGRPRIEVDMTAYIARAEESLREISRHCKELEDQIKQAEGRETQLASKVNQLKASESTLSGQMTRLRIKMERLEEELKDEQPNQINMLEEYKKQAEERVALLDVQIGDVKKMIQQLEETERRLTHEIAGIEKETALVEAEFEQIKEGLVQIEEALGNEKRNLNHYMTKRNEYKGKVEALNKQYDEKLAEVNQDLERAMNMTNGERLEVRQSPEKLVKSVRDMELRLKEQRKQTGSKEAVLKEFHEKREAYVSAKKELFYTREAINLLLDSLSERRYSWGVMRAFISMRAKNSFTMLMDSRGYYAKLILDHSRKTLELKVDVNKRESLDGGTSKTVGRRASEAVVHEASTEKDPRTLSGGEKSYSTVCLLLALWQSMANPFRALDEFDVFMDAVNRRISMKLMIDHARGDEVSRQYIFITPQDMSHVPGLGKPDVKIIKLNDPERRQPTLNFAGAGRRLTSNEAA